LRRSGPASEIGGRETVLLVDDEAMIRDFARTALERHGYTVLTAADGGEAARIFAENESGIDLVLLDLRMPVMGGDEVLAILKKKRPDVKVVVMSGYGESEAAKMFAGQGVSGFLQKPFTATRLAREVKGVLRGAAGNRPH
jgi:DNA-binding NtrC family response regulator